MDALLGFVHVDLVGFSTVICSGYIFAAAAGQWN
jgi:hypothetical protein